MFHSNIVSNNLMFSIVLWLLRAIFFSIMTFKWSAQSATAKATIVCSISFGRPYPKFIPWTIILGEILKSV